VQIGESQSDSNHAGRSGRPRRRAILAAASVSTLTVLQLLSSAGSAQAYDRSAAASYADTYWNSRPYPQYPGFDDDCTNFVSQALHAGGIKFRNAPYTWSGSNSATAYWAAMGGAAEYWTTTWSVAKTNATFTNGLYNSKMTVVPANSQGSQAPVGYRQLGDVVYYDWDGDGAINHASMITVNGGTSSDNSGTGTLVDQHTTDRRHTLWNLVKWNQQVATTTYYVVSVADGAS